MKKQTKNMNICSSVKWFAQPDISRNLAYRLKGSTHACYGSWLFPYHGIPCKLAHCTVALHLTRHPIQGADLLSNPVDQVHQDTDRILSQGEVSGTHVQNVTSRSRIGGGGVKRWPLTRAPSRTQVNRWKLRAEGRPKPHT